MNHALTKHNESRYYYKLGYLQFVNCLQPVTQNFSKSPSFSFNHFCSICCTWCCCINSTFPLSICSAQKGKIEHIAFKVKAVYCSAPLAKFLHSVCAKKYVNWFAVDKVIAIIIKGKKVKVVYSC